MNYYKSIRKHSKIPIIFYLTTLCFNLSACTDNQSTNEASFDTHIIFSSRRWWNYDIFISNVYANETVQLTKNKFIDFNPALSYDLRTLAFISDRDGNREIYLTELEWLDGYTNWRAKNLRNITNSTENEWTPVFSPVDNKIVFSTYFPSNDNYDIFIMNVDGTEKENLTKTSSYEKFPQFSPDGSFIIYQGWQKGKMDIFFTNLLDKNSINITKSIISNDIISHGNCISPDGQSIVFTSDRDGNKDIYFMTINGLEIEKITLDKADDYEPTISPDGEYIIFTSERDGSKQLYQINISNRNLRRLTKGQGDNWNARIHPNGKKIIFQSTRDKNWEIYAMNINGSNEVNISNNPATDYSYIILPNTR